MVFFFFKVLLFGKVIEVCMFILEVGGDRCFIVGMC